MSKGLTILIVLGGLLVFFGGSFISAYNYGNRTEASIVFRHKKLSNVLGNYSAKIAEMVQIPTMYKDDVKETVKAAIEGRYGEGGSKAVFQMLKESNPQIDASLYKAIQVEIAAGREEFKNEQNLFLEVKRGYKTKRGEFPTGLYLKLAGFPKIKLSKYKTVTTEYAQESVKTGIQKPLELRKN